MYTNLDATEFFTDSQVKTNNYFTQREKNCTYVRDPFTLNFSANEYMYMFNFINLLD